jgi:hypothetical protein
VFGGGCLFVICYSTKKEKIGEIKEMHIVSLFFPLPSLISQFVTRQKVINSALLKAAI